MQGQHTGDWRSEGGSLSVLSGGLKAVSLHTTPTTSCPTHTQGSEKVCTEVSLQIYFLRKGVWGTAAPGDLPQHAARDLDMNPVNVTAAGRTFHTEAAWGAPAQLQVSRDEDALEAQIKLAAGFADGETERSDLEQTLFSSNLSCQHQWGTECRGSNQISQPDFHLAFCPPPQHPVPPEPLLCGFVKVS